jgi:hypothetical protein
VATAKRQSRKKLLKPPKSGLATAKSLTAPVHKLPLSGEPAHFQKRINPVPTPPGSRFAARIAPVKVHKVALRDWSGTKRLKPS